MAPDDPLTQLDAEMRSWLGRRRRKAETALLWAVWAVVMALVTLPPWRWWA